MNNQSQSQQARQFVFYGLLLFLLGLIIGLIVPFFKNPRMGLSAHLEGVMNGMFLMILGIIWERIQLSTKLLNTTYWLALYGTFANLVAIILAAATGEGKMLPIAGGKEGTGITEMLITGLLVTLALSMIAVCVLVLTGLYKHTTEKRATA